MTPGIDGTDEKEAIEGNKLGWMLMNLSSLMNFVGCKEAYWRRLNRAMSLHKNYYVLNVNAKEHISIISPASTDLDTEETVLAWYHRENKSICSYKHKCTLPVETCVVNLY